MSKLYDIYSKKYEDAIRPYIGKSDVHTVKKHVWIAIHFLNDRNAEPWETEKMKALLNDLQSIGETELIEAIERTTREVLENSEK